MLDRDRSGPNAVGDGYYGAHGAKDKWCCAHLAFGPEAEALLGWAVGTAHGDAGRTRAGPAGTGQRRSWALVSWRAMWLAGRSTLLAVSPRGMAASGDAGSSSGQGWLQGLGGAAEA